MKRRTLLQGALAACAASITKIDLAWASISLGDLSIQSVSDGHLVLPGTFFFDGLPQNEVAEILARHDLSIEQLTPPCNATIVRNGDQIVLFDVGAGSAFMPTTGALPDSLDTLGIAPEDVTHVVFTHAHPDHIWGVLDDFDDPVFPKAQHMIGASELDYWRDPNTVGTIGEARASFAVGAARRLEAIEDILTTFNPGDEILPGVMAHASFGHTPGHMAFELRSGSESLMVVGDAIGNHHVAVERPDWPSGSDQDPELGAKTRQRLLDQLATDKMTLLGFHLPGGGIGRIERTADAYCFVPEDT
ncbi:MAG: MBL fold metallo-hydrolase [Pseudomonadota bacterium]